MSEKQKDAQQKRRDREDLRDSQLKEILEVVKELLHRMREPAPPATTPLEPHLGGFISSSPHVSTTNVKSPEPAMTPVKDFSKCLKCGKDLPEVETPRRFPEACHECVWVNADKTVAQTCEHGIPLRLQDNCLGCHKLKQVSQDESFIPTSSGAAIPT